MSTWLPWALVVFFVILLAAMPWRHPHPNHEFMLNLLRLVEDEDPPVLGSSPSSARSDKIEAQGSAVRYAQARIGKVGFASIGLFFRQGLGLERLLLWVMINAISICTISAFPINRGFQEHSPRYGFFLWPIS